MGDDVLLWNKIEQDRMKQHLGLVAYAEQRAIDLKAQERLYCNFVVGLAFDIFATSRVSYPASWNEWCKTVVPEFGCAPQEMIDRREFLALFNMLFAKSKASGSLIEWIKCKAEEFEKTPENRVIILCIVGKCSRLSNAPGQ